MSAKKLKSAPPGGECPACRGSDVIVIEDPAFPEKRQSEMSWLRSFGSGPVYSRGPVGGL
jgi:hypothetical protein